MRIAIDVDGVLSNFNKGFSRLAQNIGIDTPELDTPDVLVWNWPIEQLEWTKNELDLTWKAVRDSYNWWMTLEPIICIYEIAIINEIIDYNDVYFITTRPDTMGLSAEAQTRYWLEGIGINVARKAGVISTKHNKGALAKSLDIKLALDDHIINLENYIAHDIIAIARTWEYNKQFTPGIKNIADFEKIILNI